MHITNHLRYELTDRGYTVGTWLTLGSPMVAEVLALAGFRWLCIDGEHSPIALGDICHMIRAIESRGSTPIVRVPDDNHVTIGRVLDAGTLGIVVPHVSSSAQALGIAQACRYPPTGHRSSGSGRNLTFGHDYPEHFNDIVTVIAQIEDLQGIDAAEQIMGTEGIDIGMLGTGDLALSMGVQFGSKAHEEAIQRFLSACQRVAKPAGIPVKTGDELTKRLEQGFKFLALNSDFGLLESAAQREMCALA